MGVVASSEVSSLLPVTRLPLGRLTLHVFAQFKISQDWLMVVTGDVMETMSMFYTVCGVTQSIATSRWSLGTIDVNRSSSGQYVCERSCL